MADNKIAENAAWDTELLTEELSVLIELPTSFDIGVTGFSIPEIDALIDAHEPEADADPKADALPSSAPERIRLGDVWQLGHHRLICCDSLDGHTISQLMNGKPSSRNSILSIAT
ncbi:MAG: hypothetical protein HRU11_10370 [Parvularculaceae bacterium]|nr:hypothetical protein [Parvularculaceae bacterium]